MSTSGHVVKATLRDSAHVTMQIHGALEVHWAAIFQKPFSRDLSICLDFYLKEIYVTLWNFTPAEKRRDSILRSVGCLTKTCRVISSFFLCFQSVNKIFSLWLADAPKKFCDIAMKIFLLSIPNPKQLPDSFTQHITHRNATRISSRKRNVQVGAGWSECAEIKVMVNSLSSKNLSCISHSYMC